MLGQDGPEVQIRAGEMHYFRVPEIYWDDRLKRLRSMGLNAVSTYVPWNWHEQHDGTFDFASKRKNITKFLRLAKDHGLYVIVRAGPYICAEWEFGGLPAWLLGHVLKTGMRFRSSDSAYLSYVDRYWAQLLPMVRGELQENGGAVAMVQLENELGALQSPGQKPDYAYMQHLQKTARTYLGNRVLLISTDNGHGNVATPGVFQAINLGPWYEPKRHLDDSFSLVRKINGNVGPDFVMELWAGWFQMWHTSSWDEGKYRQAGTSLSNYVEELMKRNASFTLYMAHGGTNFGGWNSGTTVMWGAPETTPAFRAKTSLLGRRVKKHKGKSRERPPIDVQEKVVHMSFVTTSYDYAAPISEEGRHGIGGDGTDKFEAVKNAIQKYTPSSEQFPPEPAFPKLKKYGTVQMARGASLMHPAVLDVLCEGGFQEGDPQPMEMRGQQLGMILYRFTPGSEDNILLEKGDVGAELNLKGKDRMTVWHGGDRILNGYTNLAHGNSGKQFRNITTDPLEPARSGTLDVLVENLGRRAYFCGVDYGFLPEFFNDWKGLAEAPLLAGRTLEGNWTTCSLPLENLWHFNGSAPLSGEGPFEAEHAPTFFEGTFHVDWKPDADTFLRLDSGPWHTGSVYLNGFHLGRYWRDARGPFDLYVPKSSVYKGWNRIVLLEMNPSPHWVSPTVVLDDTRGPTPF